MIAFGRTFGAQRRPIARGVGLLWRACARLLRGWPCRLLLALAFADLVLGLALYPAEAMLATRIAVDLVHANFGMLLGAGLLCGSARLGAGRSAAAVAARAAGLALVAWSALVAAVLMAALGQAWRGDAPVDAAGYALGIFPGLGTHLLHLAALAVFGQALCRGWGGVAAAAAIYLVGMAPTAVFGVEHPLLPLGGPLVPWSNMAGFGPFLPAGIAAAIVWSAGSVLLLVAACLLGKRRSGRWCWARLRPLASLAWTALVLGAVAGGWLLANDAASPTAGPAASTNEAQPRYARLTLAVEIHPYRRRVAIHGVAILAHEAPAPVPELLLTLPAGLLLDAVQVTGERLPSAPRTARFRLNRPLESGERLRLEFDASLVAPTLPRLAARPRLLANGTAFALADVVPALGDPAAAAGQQATLQLRLGTPIEQVPVAPGKIVGAWREEGRRYAEFSAEQPVPFTATIHAGRYLRLASESGSVVAFVHPAHRRLGQALLAHIEAAPVVVAASLEAPLRLVEVPDYGRAFPVPRLGSYAPAISAPSWHGSVVAVSELALAAGAAVPGA